MRPALAQGLLSVALASQVASAQLPELRLGPATRSHAHEFTRIGSLRALPDGRTLVTDSGEDQLLLLPARGDDVRVIGRIGSGPGEYRDLGTLIAMPNDSSYVADASNRRVLVMYRDSIVGMRAPDDPMLTALGVRLVGADARGRVLAVRMVPPTAPPAERMRNPLLVLRATSSGPLRVDTIATIRDTEMGARSSGPPGRESITVSTMLFSSAEQAAVANEGAIAIALQDPYRVDWIAPDGRVTRGAPIEREAPPVTDAEKVWWRRRFEEWSGAPPRFSVDQFPWAATVPPYRQGALTPLADGRLLVAREPWSGAPGNVYDVIDRRGMRVARLSLPYAQRIAAVVGTRLYLVTRDEDGIERLSEHAVP